MGRIRTIARRTFLIGSAAVAGGVAFGTWTYLDPYDNPLHATRKTGDTVLNPYVRIDRSGVTIIAPRAEMGQGVHSTLAALVAEELDVDWQDVRVEHGPASHAYYNAAIFEEGVPFTPMDAGWTAETVRGFMAVPAKFLGLQITGGSTSVADAWLKMRKAGAAAREVMIDAAAQKWSIDRKTLKTEAGAVVSTDGQRATYVELAEAAAAIDPPSDPPLRRPKDWKLLGRSLPRLDMVAKCTGTAPYAIDLRLPGMLFATVRMNPRLGGKLNGFDAAEAENMPGVKKIVPLEGGVAVVATNTWLAFKAADAITFNWGEAPYPATTAEHFTALEEAYAGDYDSRFRNDGEVDVALATGGTISGEYRAPYLAHANMEPLNATALMKDGKLEIWAGSQAPTQAVIEAGKITGLDRDDITVHTTYMGGGFGRRSEMDFINLAVMVAQAMEGTPVMTTWSREEDMCHDTYRPPAIARFVATVKDGRPQALDLRCSAPSVVESQFSRIDAPIFGPDVSIVQGAWDQPYAIPNYRVTGYRAPIMLPVSYWRSVGASQNGFFHESIIDELAHAAGTDPMNMRLALIDHDPSRKVLEAVAEMSAWGSAVPAGHGRGVAFVQSFGVPTAAVIEVAAEDTQIRILKAWIAADVGTALDPRNLEAQLQGGLNFGLSAAMSGEITIADGMVEQTNFHDYDAIRIHQAPAIEVRILENADKIRGIGEPGTPPAAPALANAIFAATGMRIRELPLNKHVAFV